MKPSLAAFDQSAQFHLTTAPPSGAPVAEPTGGKITIDPLEEKRTSVDNYRLLVSSIVPRPVALVSTVDRDGNANLAPFSYFQVVNSDPPMFVLGISQGFNGPKDTLKNLLDTGECTVNIVSEWFAEAANKANINAPSGTSEWEIAGLEQEHSQIVKPAIVKRSAFSVECKLAHHHEWFSKRVEGKKTGNLVILEGVLFHVSGEVLNAEGTSLDIEKLRPISRLGGTTYGRTTEGYDLPRFQWE
ncbi:YWR1 [Cyberlindnera jadinii]|uniref:YWR1 protein n=1 Tax=Cyberlindnera jadinii (strain ATCC 18201 / CBS 1600 / BCRC 20928 / JCM 3617 / NBRC 0987 / NRRL Y-1542) TaxID=983966 RepID=A0A0H5C2G0_CYBJN|nr:YWR1 [Cyberlindnera jadinii]